MRLEDVYMGILSICEKHGLPLNYPSDAFYLYRAFLRGYEICETQIPAVANCLIQVVAAELDHKIPIPLMKNPFLSRLTANMKLGKAERVIDRIRKICKKLKIGDSGVDRAVQQYIDHKNALNRTIVTIGAASAVCLGADEISINLTSQVCNISRRSIRSRVRTLTSKKQS